jgi:HNH endonuclease
METVVIREAVKWLEKSNADLEPELLSADAARALLDDYARAEKLASFGKTVLAQRIADAAQVARATGTSMGKARAAVDAGAALKDADQVRDAFKGGSISLDQATEIARAEEARPGSSAELLAVADRQSFQVLRDKARKVVLEVEQSRGLASRQHNARRARSFRDELGMINIHLTFEPHIGTPIVNRAEAEASRGARAVPKESREPFERYLADAYAKLISGTGTTPIRKPELVVLVSHEVITRGWKEVNEGEHCKIPGVGPIAPEVAQEIARDAFLTGVFFDGKDLREMYRWTRNIPVEVRIALELGDPPDFDGIKCTDCGKRFRTEHDHVEPHAALGPASTANLNPRCHSCHRTKTVLDRKAGKLMPRNPDAVRGPPED